MKKIAEKLNPVDLKDISKYFSNKATAESIRYSEAQRGLDNLTIKQLKKLRVYIDGYIKKEVVDRELGRGKLIYTKGAYGRPACQTCHGKYGYGSGGKIPNLSIHHKFYIARQLKLFRNSGNSSSSKKNRGNDGGGVMQILAKDLTNDDINAVSKYIYDMSRI